MFTKYKSVILSKHAKERFKERFDINVDDIKELKLDTNAIDLESYTHSDGTKIDYVAIKVKDMTTILPISDNVLLTVLPEFSKKYKDPNKKWFMQQRFDQANMFFY